MFSQSKSRINHQRKIKVVISCRCRSGNRSYTEAAHHVGNDVLNQSKSRINHQRKIKVVILCRCRSGNRSYTEAAHHDI